MSGIPGGLSDQLRCPKPILLRPDRARVRLLHGLRRGLLSGAAQRVGSRRQAAPRVACGTAARQQLAAPHHHLLRRFPAPASPCSPPADGRPPLRIQRASDHLQTVLHMAPPRPGERHPTLLPNPDRPTLGTGPRSPPPVAWRLGCLIRVRVTGRRTQIRGPVVACGAHQGAPSRQLSVVWCQARTCASPGAYCHVFPQGCWPAAPQQHGRHAPGAATSAAVSPRAP